MRAQQRILHGLGAVVLALLLAGCGSGPIAETTTQTKETPPPPAKQNKAQEIQARVDAANDYLKQGNTEKAVFHLKRALEVDPKSAAINDSLANVFRTSGEYELAEEHFRRAIAIDPKFVRARNNYAAFLYDRGRYADAVKQLEAVVADTLYEKRALAFANLGKGYQKLGDNVRAEESYERAVKMDRRQWLALQELAQIRYEQGKLENAAQLYELFRHTGAQQNPRSLLLGIRLAQGTGDRNAEASYALALKSMYPKSAEYQEFAANPRGK